MNVNLDTEMTDAKTAFEKQLDAVLDSLATNVSFTYAFAQREKMLDTNFGKSHEEFVIDFCNSLRKDLLFYMRIGTELIAKEYADHVFDVANETAQEIMQRWANGLESEINRRDSAS